MTPGMDQSFNDDDDENGSEFITLITLETIHASSSSFE